MFARLWCKAPLRRRIMRLGADAECGMRRTQVAAGRTNSATPLVLALAAQLLHSCVPAALCARFICWRIFSARRRGALSAQIRFRKAKDAAPPPPPADSVTNNLMQTRSIQVSAVRNARNARRMVYAALRFTKRLNASHEYLSPVSTLDTPDTNLAFLRANNRPNGPPCSIKIGPSRKEIS